MRKLTYLAGLSALLALATPVFCQIQFSEHPKVGDRMPDFVIDDIYQYEKDRLRPSDFRGKWLFLVFWYRGCSNSISDMPKLNEWQREFRSDLQIVLIGNATERAFGKGIKPLYDRLSKKQQLDLVSVFDSTIVTKWEIYGYPHIIVVDPTGIIKAITAGFDLTTEKIRALLKGEEVSIQQKGTLPVFNSDDTRWKDPNLVHRSILSKWNGESQHVPAEPGTRLEDGRIRFYITQVPLVALYNIAYFGRWNWFWRDSIYEKVYPWPVIEVDDSSRFEYDFTTGKGIYNFEMVSTPGVNADPTDLLRRELYARFGYETSIEERIMPVWKLKLLPDAGVILKTKGGRPGYLIDSGGDGGVAGFAWNNFPFNHFVETLAHFWVKDRIPLINDTGIDYNIDISFDALMTDREQVLRELHKIGLDLVLEGKAMQVLVIRDGK